MQIHSVIALRKHKNLKGFIIQDKIIIKEFVKTPCKESKLCCKY